MDTLYIIRLTRLLAIVSILAIVSVAQQQPVRGLDPKNLDTSVRPCDDFYQYANGGWLANNPIPPAFSSWGSFTELAEHNNQVLYEILEAAAKATNAPRGSNTQKIGDFYASGMDSVRIEQLGATPLAADLNRISAIQSVGELQSEIARLHQMGVNALFSISAAQDPKNSEMMIVHLGQSGLGLPDRDFYLAEDDRSRTIREEYVKHMVTMFGLLGDGREKAESAAQRVMALETRLAKASFTRVENRDPNRTYNKMTPSALSALTPAISWNRYFSTVGLVNAGDVNVRQPKFFEEASVMMNDVSLDDWKVYLRWRLLSQAAPALSSAFVEESFNFHGRILTGAKELQPRWRRIRGVIDGLLGEALGQLYVEKAFSPYAKERAKEMVENLIAAFREHIQNLPWMDDQTKTMALAKLSSFGVKIGYPDVWRDYSGLHIDRASYMENLRRARMFAFRYNMSRVGKPVNKMEWFMTPPTVNAYYSPQRNEIVFPAGILQPPFFDPDADDAVNYGGMGAVIGHELTHGFDDQGSKFDAEGNLKDWWTPESRARFEERAEMVVKQFEGYVAIDTLRINGRLTLGENIADLGGLSIAYTALQKALQGKPRPLIDGFTPEQRFFLAWAQIWRRNATPEALRLQVRTDSHSPARFRTNGPLSNMPEFQNAFGCSDADPLVRSAADRAAIW